MGNNLKNNDVFVLRRLVYYIKKVDKKYSIISFFKNIISAVNSLLLVYLPKVVIDIVLNYKSMFESLKYLVIYLSICFIVNILDLFIGRYTTISDINMNNGLEKLLSLKIMNVRYELLENTEFLDLREKAYAGINMLGLKAILYYLSQIIRYSFIFVGLFGIILSTNKFLFLLIVLIHLCIFFILIKVNKTSQKIEHQSMGMNRKYGAYVDALSNIKGQKDIRIYDLSMLLTNNFQKYNKEKNLLYIKLSKYKYKREMIITMLSNTAFVLVAIYCAMGIRGLYGLKISMGSVILLITSVISLNQNMKEFSFYFNEIKNNIFYIKPLIEILDMSGYEISPIESKNSTCNTKLEDKINEIEFKGVSFRYPKGNDYILKNLNFKISKGEKISIVGLNGAGKTTLVKLICRLFTVTEGEILVNGININNYEYSSYIKEISCVFQDFKILSSTILQNIICSNSEYNNKVEGVIKDVGIYEKIQGLKERESTFIGKNLNSNGVEFSGGELQKIAIARALYKDSSLIILDEPTSALDPKSESQIYEDFYKLVDNKIAIFISHRMSSSIFCDKILLINNGVMEDFDTHYNLIKNKDGLYYKLFTTQAKNYEIIQ